MLVRVRLFAILRERAGAEALELELADGATVDDVLAAAGARQGLAELLDRLPVAVAVNREYAPRDRRLGAGDEVALIPPVSGGAEPDAATVSARISSEPLDPGRLERSVRRPGAGAVVVFVGTTRDVPSLVYEAYAEMATEQIEAILAAAVRHHGLEAAAAEHRVGSVPLSEPSVVVAVSAAHRDEAFAGAREAIDAIKSSAAIWKQERRSDGESSWVAGTPPQ
jgi:molybdopterin synthase catalytic subunit